MGEKADIGYENWADYQEFKQKYDIEINTGVKNKIVPISGIYNYTKEYEQNNDGKKLTDIQIKALLSINDYSNDKTIKNSLKDNPDNPLIFFFEGAGSYDDSFNGIGKEPNKNRIINKNYHPDGRNGAMAVVVKNGKIEYITTNASTLPDNPNGYHKDAGSGDEIGRIATAKEGVYPYMSGLHKSQNSKRIKYSKDGGVMKLGNILLFG